MTGFLILACMCAALAFIFQEAWVPLARKVITALTFLFQVTWKILAPRRKDKRMSRAELARSIRALERECEVGPYAKAPLAQRRPGMMVVHRPGVPPDSDIFDLFAEVDAEDHALCERNMAGECAIHQREETR